MNADRFAERLKLAIGSESVNSFARKCEVSESVVRKYLAGGMPGLDKAIIMARVAGVSLSWLATDEGPMRPEGAGAEHISIYILQRSIDIVEEWLEIHNRKLNSKKKAEVIAKLYQAVLEISSNGGPEVDKKTAHAFLRLVA